MNRKIVAVILLLTVQLFAAVWQDTKVEFHRGFTYLNPFVPPTVDSLYEASVVSFSHANGWTYGDNFFWFDATRMDDPVSVSLYGEFAPRLSIFKIAGADRTDKFLTDLTVAGMIEFDMSDFVYLYGAGVSLNIPAFAFFNLNGYVRDDPDFDGVTFMLNTSWALPFKMGPVGMLFDGFLDFAGKEGSDGVEKEAFMITQPALFLDLGNFWKKPGTLFVGSEVEIWHNKYGVKDKNSVAPQISFRWNF